MRKLAEAITFLVLQPLLIWSKLPLPEYTSFTAPSQLLSLIPGLTGVLLRRIWYQTTLKRCGKNLTVDWLGVIRTRQTQIGDQCTIGVCCWISWAKLGNDVIMGSHVTILSGGRQHAFSDTNQPIRSQAGRKDEIHIGDDVWIGARATIMANISGGTVVGAGSVVTRTYPDRCVIAGNPARLLRSRESSCQ